MRFLATLFLLAALPAQVVRLANYSSEPFSGWARAVVDTKPLPVGEVDGVICVRGRQTGLDTWAVDLRVALKPNEQRTIDLGTAKRARWAIGPLPADPARFFGARLPTVNGTELQLRDARQDGTALSMHFQGRLAKELPTGGSASSLWHVDFWCLWRPDEPGLMTGEVVCCASNPSIPDVLCESSGAASSAVAASSTASATSSTGVATDADSTTALTGLRLSWGDALVHVPGAGWNAPIVPPSTFATGQARGVPVTLVWPRNVINDWFAVVAGVNRSVCAVGIAKLLPDGNPTLPAGFNATAFTTGLYQESLRRLHTWEPPLLGPAPQSGTTGSQEDQVFVGGECFAPDGLGAEQVRYLNALRILSRPCHHLQEDGTIVDPSAMTPRLTYWDGMPFAHPVVNPYGLLGKPRNPTVDECHGWSGPDVEHWLMNQTVAAARLTGSRALQWELRCQAMVYFGQQTTYSGWSTSQPWASRAVGWEAIAAVHLWRNLEDRLLAERVRLHWLDRFGTVIAPAWRDRDVVDVRFNDPRLGPGAWTIPWQASVGAYGLDLAGEQFGVPEARSIALRLASVVVRDAWDFRDGRWVSRAQQPVSGPYMFGDESFNGFGMPLAPAVVLRHDPNNARASSIWSQIAGNGGSWIAPGVLQQ